jgi:hypothetical protein
MRFLLRVGVLIKSYLGPSGPSGSTGGAAIHGASEPDFINTPTLKRKGLYLSRFRNLRKEEKIVPEISTKGPQKEKAQCEGLFLENGWKKLPLIDGNWGMAYCEYIGFEGLGCGWFGF